MVEIGTWRARIGNFNFAKGVSRLRDKASYLSEEKLGADDVVIGYICLCLLVGLLQCGKETLQLSLNESTFQVSDNFRGFGENGFYGFSTVCGDLVSKLSDMNASSSGWHGLDPVAPLMSDVRCVVILAVNLVFCVWRLILSHDVEMNPGPPKKTDTRPESNVDSRISQLEESMEEKLTRIMKAIESQTQTMLNIQTSQRLVMSSISEIDRKVSDLSNVCSRNSEDIKELKNNQEDISDTLEGLQEEIDRLEGFSRRNNVKVFGLQEGLENNSTCEELVKGLLSDYYPGEEWDRDVIERAHRLGNRNNPNRRGPRPVIAKFQRWGDAMRVMKNRDAREKMNNDGIRLAQDLTKRQSDKLRSLRQEGKSGYFVKGKLRVRDYEQSDRTRRDTAGIVYGSDPADRPKADHTRPTNNELHSGRGDVMADRTEDVDNTVSSEPIRGAEGGSAEVMTGHRVRRASGGDAWERGAESPRRVTRSATHCASERQASLRDLWGDSPAHSDATNSQ
jgi:hypothetical protein